MIRNFQVDLKRGLIRIFKRSPNFTPLVPFNDCRLIFDANSKPFNNCFDRTLPWDANMLNEDGLRGHQLWETSYFQTTKIMSGDISLHKPSLDESVNQVINRHIMCWAVSGCTHISTMILIASTIQRLKHHEDLHLLPGRPSPDPVDEISMQATFLIQRAFDRKCENTTSTNLICESLDIHKNINFKAIFKTTDGRSFINANLSRSYTCTP